MQVTTKRAGVLGATALATATLLTAAWGVAAGSGDPADVPQHVDFWNYDPQTGKKTADSSPGVAPQGLARLYAPTTAVARPSSRQVYPDFWNYDPVTGDKVANTSPGVAPEDLASLWSGSG